MKLLAKSNPKYSKVIINVSANDTKLRQLEVTKPNVELVCNYAKSMLDSVDFSGPLPNSTSDMFSHMSWLHCYLSPCYPENDMAFIDNWQTYVSKTTGRRMCHAS